MEIAKSNNDTLREAIRTEALRLYPTLAGLGMDALIKEDHRARYDEGDEGLAEAVAALLCLCTEDDTDEDLVGARRHIINALIKEALYGSPLRYGPERRAHVRALHTAISARFPAVEITA